MQSYADIFQLCVEMQYVQLFTYTYICALHVDGITGRPARMHRMGSWAALSGKFRCFQGDQQKNGEADKTYPSIGGSWTIGKCVYPYSGRHVMTSQELWVFWVETLMLVCVWRTCMGRIMKDALNEWAMFKCRGKPNNEQTPDGWYNRFTRSSGWGCF